MSALWTENSNNYKLLRKGLMGMRILPILFNTDMVRAILDERKTATRRVIKFPQNRFTGEIPKADKLRVYKNTILADKISFHEEPRYVFDVKPLCKPGDILYVRETWCKGSLDYGEEKYYYKADNPAFHCQWYPSIHMPKAAARIWLKVKEVRVERLQDIDDAGVVAEGLQIGDPYDELWNSTINKKDFPLYGWDANPWVWVIEFERCGKPESEVLK